MKEHTPFTGQEVFEKQAQLWWNAEGPFWPLHKMNQLRLSYIVDHIIAEKGLENRNIKPLEGLLILDVGCGGGLLSEALHKNGAKVVGIDAVEKNIRIAEKHAQQMGLGIDYRHTTADQMAQYKDQYDVVVALEVIEHVDNPQKFIADLSKLTKGGGLVFTSTINRTLMSLICAKYGAEYVLKLLPKGTHEWKKFVKPEEMQTYFEKNSCTPKHTQGVKMHIRQKQFSFTSNLAMNYIMFAQKQRP